MTLKSLARSGSKPDRTKHREWRWVIASRRGLYVGQQQTRASMIAIHVSEKLSGMKLDGGIAFGEISRFTDGRSLDPEQRRAWRWCQKQGDRCIRVLISY